MHVARQEVAEAPGADRRLVVLGSESLRRQSRVGALVDDPTAVEPDREGSGRLLRRLGGETQHRRRVDATAEQRTDGYVAERRVAAARRAPRRHPRDRRARMPIARYC